jgi:hypothetical protein
VSIDDAKRTLQAALFLIVLGLIAIGVADHWNWRDLAGAGGIVLGYGGGILQGKGTSQNTTKGGGDIINAADPTAPIPKQ